MRFPKFGRKKKGNNEEQAGEHSTPTPTPAAAEKYFMRSFSPKRDRQPLEVAPPNNGSLQQTRVEPFVTDQAKTGVEHPPALEAKAMNSAAMNTNQEGRKVPENGGHMAPKSHSGQTTTERAPPTRVTLSSSIPKNIVAPRNSSVTSSIGGEATSGQMFDDTPDIVKSYDRVPLIEQTKLPRGGVSMETEAVGRVQFGIPPETIKDSMRLGLQVPSVYIVPVERFCREMGPALGVNLAEFEFPAYFNFFVFKKRCTLIVDSEDAERNIRRVFSETLLGPVQFRREEDPIIYEEEDFAPEFPREAIPNFYKELEHFRIVDGKPLYVERLLNFRHFDVPGDTGVHENLGIPPPLVNEPEELGDNGENREKATKPNSCPDAQKETTPSPSKPSNWTYSQARWIGDVATVWAPNATEEQIKNRTCKRVEIFKMPGGTEYILHDIDENNHIVGKARFSGHVKVSESMSVDGFGGKSMLDDAHDDDVDDDDDDDDDDDVGEEKNEDYDSDSTEVVRGYLKRNLPPPTFHPPSFGVTVLGNSHGFDKSGSVSGYVLWINGRGVMIDPPPYSSATLEREGIRPRTIVGIILTHCHADHDAGAFQKVLTGSPVVVITTPTIYKSFIRKYAALSALSPALLRHSHRHKPAIVGRPLRFQGATFRFSYTLHSIPCVGFRVEWRGRSMVFTGDHLNLPFAIDDLQEKQILSKARADDLRNLPLQETDLLLHEAGAPPLHTPLKVLMNLPDRVKSRLYVVHTSALPDDCDLRVAPTGTAGTIRLDRPQKTSSSVDRSMVISRGSRESVMEDENLFQSPWSSASNEYEPINEDSMSIESSDSRMMSSFAHLSTSTTKSSKAARSNSLLGNDSSPPLVSLRPASSTDAWFILNLLSAVPFLTSLSYASTMEVLETARVDAYCKDDVIVSASRRNHVLCVVWEGTCVESKVSRTRGSSRKSTALLPISEDKNGQRSGTVWHAGDWTGPIALQPEKRLSGQSTLSADHDVVAMSSEGVKVITVEFSSLHAILKSGSALYRKYLERRNQQRKVLAESSSDLKKPTATQQLLEDAIKNLNVLELLDCNSALRKLSAVQKRHLESLAEGPISFLPGERLWRAGAPVDKAFIIVSGTSSFVPRRRNGGSVGLPSTSKVSPPTQRASDSSGGAGGGGGDDLTKFALSLGESMRQDAATAVRELGTHDNHNHGDIDSEDARRARDQLLQFDSIFSRISSSEGVSSSITDEHDFVKLSRGLQKRADLYSKAEGVEAIDDTHDMDMADDVDSLQQFENVFLELEAENGKPIDSNDKRLSLARRRSSRARFANKVLGRLYSRRAFTGGLVFSRGHFLGDVSKMVAGLLSADTEHDMQNENDDEGSTPKYGFGEKMEGGGDRRPNSQLDSVSEMVIHEQEGDELIVHSSTLTAGKEGCVVLVFPKASLIPFLDEYPGLLLSLLGTQVVV